MITVLLVDDQPNVRRGLRMWLSLEPGISVVGEAECGNIAVTKALELRPNVVLMDVEMPCMDGIAATTIILSQESTIAIVMLSLHGDPITRKRALAAGACAFVEKQQPEAELLAAIKQAALFGATS